MRQDRVSSLDLRVSEKKEVGRRVEVAIEGCFAIEGCLPQNVLKWPKKLPAEAGNFRTWMVGGRV